MYLDLLQVFVIKRHGSLACKGFTGKSRAFFVLNYKKISKLTCTDIKLSNYRVSENSCCPPISGLER